MANRISIYGRAGEKNTERLRRELRSMSLTYDFYDIVRQPQASERLVEAGIDPQALPKVEVACAYNPGSVFLSNPDVETLRQTLYSEEVLGVTSFWI